jgi:hypothetical protein
MNKSCNRGKGNLETEAEGDVASIGSSRSEEFMRRLVVEEIILLSKPVLSPLLQHFYNQQSHYSVAGHYGRSEEWAELRLNKSLKLFRKRLDERFGFDRRKWCTMLTPLAKIDLKS